MVNNHVGQTKIILQKPDNYRVFLRTLIYLWKIIFCCRKYGFTKHWWLIIIIHKVQLYFLWYIIPFMDATEWSEFQFLVQIWVFVKIWVFAQNFSFWSIIQFLLKIWAFCQNLSFLLKFAFFVKICVLLKICLFGKNLSFWSDFEFWFKISVFGQNLSFWS